MLRILFDLPRSSICNKDLLLHVNPYKTLKNEHKKNDVTQQERRGGSQISET